jgi:hypothetical protein
MIPSSMPTMSGVAVNSRRETDAGMRGRKAFAVGGGAAAGGAAVKGSSATVTSALTPKPRRRRY